MWMYYCTITFYWLHREQHNHMWGYCWACPRVAGECIVLLHSWLNREQYNHMCEYQNLSRFNMWMYCGFCIPDWTENNTIMCEYQSLSRFNMWMYCAPAFLTEQRTIQSHVWIPEPVQVLHVNVLCPSIPDWTENNTITGVNTRACPGLTCECIVLRLPAYSFFAQFIGPQNVEFYQIKVHVKIMWSWNC